jgi:hypothetical protein
MSETFGENLSEPEIVQMLAAAREDCREMQTSAGEYTPALDNMSGHVAAMISLRAEIHDELVGLKQEYEALVNQVRGAELYTQAEKVRDLLVLALGPERLHEAAQKNLNLVSDMQGWFFASKAIAVDPHTIVAASDDKVATVGRLSNELKPMGGQITQAAEQVATALERTIAERGE